MADNENRVGRLNVEVAYTQAAAPKVSAGRLNTEFAYTQTAIPKVSAGRLNTEFAYTQAAATKVRASRLNVEVAYTPWGEVTVRAARLNVEVAFSSYAQQECPEPEPRIAAASEIAADIDIVNLALTRLGQPGIMSFADDVEAARLARTTYAPIRNRVMAEHPWNFACTHAEIAKNTTLPDGVWEYDKSYNLPNDHLRVLRIEGQSADDGDEWQIYDDVILTNLGDSTIKIKYIRLTEEVGKYSPGFIDTLAAALELEWVEHLIKSSNQTELRAAAYENKLRLSRSMDGAEGTPLRTQNFSWINRR